jgi:FkbM family methyltransferase
VLQRVARLTADALGRDNAAINLLRPVFSSILERLSYDTGLERTVNGERFRVLAEHRHCFPDHYDPELSRILRKRVKSSFTCLNVGANLGIYTLQLARWSAPNGQVVAFEPNPKARQVLERHVELNDFATRVSIEPSAVGSRPGTAILYAKDCDGMSRLGTPNPMLAGQTCEFFVEVVTLDDFCRVNGLRPDIIVMDVEGAELAALQGAGELIRSRKEDLSIFVELHPGAWDATYANNRHRVQELMDSLHRRIVPLTGQVDPLKEYGHVELVYAPA